MKKVKVFLEVKDKAFSERIKRLSKEVEIVGESTSLEAIKGNPKRADLLFLDRIPSMGFIHLKAKGVIVALRYSRRKEFLAARSGAKGFITKDIPELYLLKAIKVISSGEIWMTRVTVARVFEEYGRIIPGGSHEKTIYLGNHYIIFNYPIIFTSMRFGLCY